MVNYAIDGAMLKFRLKLKRNTNVFKLKGINLYIYIYITSNVYGDQV